MTATAPEECPASPLKLGQHVAGAALRNSAAIGFIHETPPVRTMLIGMRKTRTSALPASKFLVVVLGQVMVAGEARRSNAIVRA